MSDLSTASANENRSITPAVAAELRIDLLALGGNALRERYRLATGKSTSSHNRPYLISSILEALGVEVENHQPRYHGGGKKIRTAHHPRSAAAADVKRYLSKNKDTFRGTKEHVLRPPYTNTIVRSKSPPPKRKPYEVGKMPKDGRVFATTNKGKYLKRAAKANAKAKLPAWKDPRVPKAGTTLRHEYMGKKVEVKVLSDGFRFRGKHYTSLSTIAETVAGGSVNGYVFFGLNK